MRSSAGSEASRWAIAAKSAWVARRGVGIDGAAGQDREPRQRGAAARSQAVGLLPLLQQRRLDRGRVARYRGAFADALRHLAQAAFEIAERRGQRAELLLQQRRGEE